MADEDETRWAAIFIDRDAVFVGCDDDVLDGSLGLLLLLLALFLFLWLDFAFELFLSCSSLRQLSFPLLLVLLLLHRSADSALVIHQQEVDLLVLFLNLFGFAVRPFIHLLRLFFQLLIVGGGLVQLVEFCDHHLRLSAHRIVSKDEH